MISFQNELLLFLTILVDFSLFMLVYRFMGKTGLFIWIAIASILVNIQVLKTCDMFGITITLGNVLYGTTFLATDIISENYTEKDANKGVIIGFVSIFTMTIIMNISLLFIPGEDDFAHSSLCTIFKIMPRVAFASIMAFVFSHFHDVWAYNFWRKVFPAEKFIFIRNNASTLISQLIDTVVFVFFAFFGLYSKEILFQIWLSTYLIKLFTAFLDTICVYIAASWHKKRRIREF